MKSLLSNSTRLSAKDRGGICLKQLFYIPVINNFIYVCSSLRIVVL